MSSPPALQVPLCATCDKDINLPCAIFLAYPCSGCTNRTVDCCLCDGQGKQEEVFLEDGTHPDCNACVGSGFLVGCRVCGGQGSLVATSRWSRRRSRQPCVNCNARGMYRCRICDMTGQILKFQHFCTGDRPDDRTTRRHPNAADYERWRWNSVDFPAPPP